MHSLPITYSLISNTPARQHMCTRRYADAQGCLQAFFLRLMTLSVFSLPTTSPLQRTHTRQPCHAPACRCANMPTCQCANQRTDAPMHLHASDAPSNAPTHQCTTRRSVDMPTCQHANVCQCARAQLSMCGPMHMPAPGMLVPLSPTSRAHPL